MLYYSSSDNVFYDSDIHAVIPPDAIPISANERADLLDGQAQGRLIRPDEDGRPVLVDRIDLMSLAERKQEKKAQIEAARDACRKDSNVIVQTADGTEWQMDPESQTELSQALTLFSAIGTTPEGYEWRDAENVNHPADLALLTEIAAARAEQVNAAWRKSWQLKDQVDAVTTLQELDEIIVPEKL